MNKIIDAVYKKGAFHPVRPLKGLKENARVRVTVESASVHPLERFAGILSTKEADQMLKLVEEEFEQVDANAW